MSIHASAEENPDLLWGIRGGGGNFGIVTSFEYRLHKVGPAVLAGAIFWPMEDAPDVLRYYRDWIRTVPDDLMTILNLRRAPPLAAVPEHLHGRPVCGIALCWSGAIEHGEDVIRPLRSFGRPLLDLVTTKPYLAHQSMFDAVVPHGWHYYWKSCEIGELKDDVIDTLTESSLRITSPRSYTVVFQLGGAVSRVPEDATAYGHRDAAHNVNINAVWLPGDAEMEAHLEWTRAMFTDLAPHQLGVYVNFLGNEGQDRVRAAFGEEKYARLAALKARYDPDNFFRMNQNVEPRTPRLPLS